MNTPLVSVIIDTYNYGHFIEEAIESVLRQDFPPTEIEIIVVDDGSTDDTSHRVKKYENKIQYIYQDNKGQGGAFNTGFNLAKGQIICLLDSDDYYYPNKIREVMIKFNEDQEIGVVHHKVHFVDRAGKKLRAAPFRPALADGWLKETILKYGYCPAIPAIALSYRKCYLDRILPIPEEDFRLSADSYLSTQVPLLSRLGVVRKYLSCYRLHETNNWAHAVTTLEEIEKRLRHTQRRAHYVELRAKELFQMEISSPFSSDQFYIKDTIFYERLRGNKLRAVKKYAAFLAALGRDDRFPLTYKIWQIFNGLCITLLPLPLYASLTRLYRKALIRPFGIFKGFSDGKNPPDSPAQPS